MTDLSPVAQVVLDAAFDASDEWNNKPMIAATLRALAEYRTPPWDGIGPTCRWHPTPYVRQELLAIADELEAQ